MKFRVILKIKYDIIARHTIESGRVRLAKNKAIELLVDEVVRRGFTFESRSVWGLYGNIHICRYWLDQDSWASIHLVRSERHSALGIADGRKV